MLRSDLVKRLLDLAICLVALPFAIPLCLALLVAIRLETPGSPLFVQTRVGRNQRPFRMYKLRTMGASTGDHASHLVGIDKITRLGSVLRRLKLDELPQLVNVAMGAMSIVGPRPCLPKQTELIAERERRSIFAYRPGITGPAQIRGIDMSTPVLLAEVEAEYFARASIADDVRMMVKTVAGGGRGDAAAATGTE